jgi:phenylalanyl-tRNA synthetase beta chain
MRTDASARFEKGLDPENTTSAVERACELIELLSCGEVLDGMIDVNHTDYVPRVLPFEPERICRHIGADIPADDMRRYLEPLGFVVGKETVTVPSWRADVEGMADLSEEVARFYGYDRIPTTMFKGPILKGGYTDKQKAEKLVSELCRGLGFSEIMTYSFVSPSVYDRIRLPKDSPLRKCLTLLNPLGEDTSVMRTTALPSMLETLARNANNRNPSARLYELASVYLPGEDKLPGASDASARRLWRHRLFRYKGCG